MVFLDDGGRRALALAQDEAIRFHHGFIGPEHLLLGVLRDHGTLATRVLSALGVKMVEARKCLEHMSGRGDPKHKFEEIVLLPESNKIIELASAEAKRMGAERVGPVHLLLGITYEPGKAEAILQGFGVSVEELRQKILTTSS